MKKVLIVLSMIVGMVSPAVAADPVEGMWKTQANDKGFYGHVKVSECGSTLCGVLEKSFNKSGTEIKSDDIGKKIIWNMVAEGGGKYDDGMVWSPELDKTYKSKMELTGDKLAIQGCVMGICRDGSNWTRLP